MQFFFTENAELNSLISLPESEAHHLVHVLRYQSGDEVILINGKGTSFKAVILSISKKNVQLQVNEIINEQKEPSIKLHLVVAPTKNFDRMEWMVEKATELNAYAFHFIKTDNSERKEIKIDKLKQTAITACKQSGRLWMPKLFDLLPLSVCIKNFQTNTNLYAGMMHEQTMTLSHFKPAPGNHYFLIGPEGGFSPQEEQFLLQQNVKAVKLSENRLRTETAALSVVSFFNFEQLK